MFDNLNWWEITVLLMLALFIFGPERLPKAIADGLRMIRTLRNMARNATSDLSRELGTDVRVEDLNPKTFIRKHLLTEEDEAALRRPIDEAIGDLKKVTEDVNGSVNGLRGAPGRGTTSTSTPAPEAPAALPPQRYDTDAT
ncbi:Sec-independent protein translocase subunit TatB [Luedemannella helvata]|uniref:Sec-independent protein translocase protein TatB n=1 Tax=Luedemannella helvata TaxID=349315 RepID=A0ABN2L1Q7_9ACTN